MAVPVGLIGSTGKVGRAWLRLSGSGPNTPAVEPFGGSRQINLATPQSLDRLQARVDENPGGLLVMAAAFTDVDGCERDPERAEVVNVHAVDATARALAPGGGSLLFYSSDFIFDGRGPRGEDDAPRPLSVYGHTKMRAEEAIKASGVDHLIVRINVPLAPPEDGQSFYSFVTENLKAGKQIRIVTDQWSNPLDTDRIARWSWEAWQRGVRGTLHLGGGTYATRFDIARIMAAYVGADSALIQPTRSGELQQAAERPRRGGLLIARQTELFGTAPDLATILKSLPK